MDSRSAIDLQQTIAFAVAKTVVYTLEVVEIEEQHRHALATRRARQRVLDAVAKQRAIREAGERIMERLMNELRFERPVLVLQREVERSRFEKISCAQQHFGALERLREKILRAARERAIARLARRVGGEHEHRQILAGRGAVAQRREQREAIDMRHVQIEHHEIGVQLVEQRQRRARISGATDLGVATGQQHALQQAHVRLLVVDDENARARCRVVIGCGHAALRSPSTRDTVPIDHGPDRGVFLGERGHGRDAGVLLEVDDDEHLVLGADSSTIRSSTGRMFVPSLCAGITIDTARPMTTTPLVRRNGATVSASRSRSVTRAAATHSTPERRSTYLRVEGLAPDIGATAVELDREEVARALRCGTARHRRTPIQVLGVAYEGLRDPRCRTHEQHGRTRRGARTLPDLDHEQHEQLAQRGERQEEVAGSGVHRVRDQRCGHRGRRRDTGARRQLQGGEPGRLWTQ